MLDDTREHLAPLGPTDGIRRGSASRVHPSAAQMAPEAPDEAQAPPVRKLSERWYVVTHTPFEGFRARNAIRRLGFEAHWPRIIDRQPRRNDVILPLYPCYLFARFDVTRGGWGAIVDKRHAITAILGQREFGAPVPMPVGAVEHLIAQAPAIDLPIDPTGDLDEVLPPLDEGSEVALLDVRFMGAKGMLKESRGGDRVKVLLNMLGGERVVDVPREMVRKVEAA
jgi:transcription antitermination factor NusG